MWVYCPLSEVKAEVGLHEVETYISRRQNTVSQYIMTRDIMDLFFGQRNAQGKRCPRGGGSGRACTWRGIIWRIRRWNCRRGRGMCMGGVETEM